MLASAASPRTNEALPPVERPAVEADVTPPSRKPDPFALADFIWLTGNAPTKEAPDLRKYEIYPCDLNKNVMSMFGKGGNV